MTPSDIRRDLEKLKISQDDYAKLIGVSPRALAVWMKEEKTITANEISLARQLWSDGPEDRKYPTR
jgi:DNA-binding transcriptional regulator YiaG